MRRARTHIVIRISNSLHANAYTLLEITTSLERAQAKHTV